MRAVLVLRSLICVYYLCVFYLSWRTVRKTRALLRFRDLRDAEEVWTRCDRCDLKLDTDWGSVCWRSSRDRGETSELLAAVLILAKNMMEKIWSCWSWKAFEIILIHNWKCMRICMIPTNVFSWHWNIHLPANLSCWTIRIFIRIWVWAQSVWELWNIQNGLVCVTIFWTHNNCLHVCISFGSGLLAIFRQLGK